MGYREVWVEDPDLEDFDDQDLIDELSDRGYVIYGGETEVALFKLRQAYLLDSPENFRKFVEKFLDENGMPV
jgi:hypothetical protein